MGGACGTEAGAQSEQKEPPKVPPKKREVPQRFTKKPEPAKEPPKPLPEPEEAVAAEAPQPAAKAKVEDAAPVEPRDGPLENKSIAARSIDAEVSASAEVVAIRCAFEPRNP